MNLNLSQLLELEKKTVSVLSEAGRKLADKWQETHVVSLKKNHEPVTELDVEIEKDVRSALSNIFPEAGFIVEEGKNDEHEGYNWIIDPIDQTKNFIGKIPLFYTQVALLHDGEPVLGVIHNPVSKQTISASLGNGTKLNDHPVDLHLKDCLEDCVLDIDFGGIGAGEDWKFDVAKKLFDSTYRVRVTGGSFSPYMLTGGIDAYVVLTQSIKIVDKMPRIIIIREAGLDYEETELNGHPVAISGNSAVISEIKKLLF